MKYTVVFEKGDANYAAYVPDLPGCIATGDTRDEVERLIKAAIVFHIEGLRGVGQPIPPGHRLVRARRGLAQAQVSLERQRSVFVSASPLYSDAWLTTSRYL